MYVQGHPFLANYHHTNKISNVRAQLGRSVPLPYWSHLQRTSPRRVFPRRGPQWCSLCSTSLLTKLFQRSNLRSRYIAPVMGRESGRRGEMSFDLPLATLSVTP